jgi:hypothetical protein
VRIFGGRGCYAAHEAGCVCWDGGEVEELVSVSRGFVLVGTAIYEG